VAYHTGFKQFAVSMALDYTVIEYDKTTMDILSKLVMLNIARSHQHQPMHLAMTRNTILLNIR